MLQCLCMTRGMTIRTILLLFLFLESGGTSLERRCSVSLRVALVGTFLLFLTCTAGAIWGVSYMSATQVILKHETRSKTLVLIMKSLNELIYLLRIINCASLTLNNPLWR